MQFTTKNIIDALKRLDYPIYKGDYNLNLIGIRSNDTDANTFNDVLVVLYEVNKKQHMHCFDMTTDPGVYYLNNPINMDGTAVLKPGHYPSCWQVGRHKNQYYALKQTGEMTVYRDGNLDDVVDIDDDQLQTGLFGINLHRAFDNATSLSVGKFSAGCQVLAGSLNFDLLMALVKKSAAMYGPRFSYSLLTEGDL